MSASGQCLSEPCKDISSDQILFQLQACPEREQAHLQQKSLLQREQIRRIPIRRLPSQSVSEVLLIEMYSVIR